MQRQAGGKVGLCLLLQEAHASILVLFSPDAKLVQYLHERLSPVTQTILDFRRDLRIFFPYDQTVFFQFFQIGTQCLVGYVLQIPFQFIKMLSGRNPLALAGGRSRFSFPKVRFCVIIFP